MRRFVCLLLILVSLVAFSTETLYAQSGNVNIPKKMRFQGSLKDALGNPIEGFINLTFRIYDVEEGGLPLWVETQQNIEVANGKLDVVLGSVSAINLAFDKEYYLGIEVEQDGEMSPRFILTSTPYAFSAQN